MNSAEQCLSCGAPLGAEARGGLCPRCLFAAAHTPLASGALDPTSEAPSAASEISALSRRFPEPGHRPPTPDITSERLEGSPLNRSDAPPLPCRFGDYELLEEISRGGMGVVFRARQLSLDRIVAVKLLLGGALSSPEYIKRFRLEAAAAGGLQHPHIVAIHEVGLLEGQHYIAMDYIAGPNLGEVVAAQPLPARRAATYVRAVAEAIEFAHARGILHRDLKPSNILLDDNDQPRVTDFGLAKRLDSDVDLTLTGQVLGSPNYMPPEQATGRRGNLDRRADVYSLGAVLYHLLTGRPPFHAETLATTLEQVRSSEPIAPRRLNPSVPRDLETICLKCLEKEPARRYPSSQALAAELDRFLRAEPIQARPLGAPGRAWRWCRRKPALAVLAALAGLLLLTLAVGGPIVAARQRTAAERYRRLAYAGDVRAAYDWWERGLLQQATNALERHVPHGIQGDLREFTWRFVDRLCQPYRQTPSLKATGPVMWLAVSGDGRWLAASGAFEIVRIWDLESDRDDPAVELRTGEPFFAGPLAFSPDARFLVTAGFSPERSRKGLQVWDRSTGRRLTQDPGLPARCCEFSPDGTLLAVAISNHVVVKSVGGDWHEVRRLTNHTAVVWSARFSRDGRRLVTASLDRTAIVWEMATGEALRVLPHTNWVFQAVFSPDGRKVATASERSVCLWDLATEKRLGSYTHASVVPGLDFSPEGRWIASGGWDGLVKVWDWNVDTLRELRGHSQVVHVVRFLPGGRRLASGSWDGTIKLWDLGTPPPNDVLEGRVANALSNLRSPVVFARDGGAVATVSRDGSEILLWNTATGGFRERLRGNRVRLPAGEGEAPEGNGSGETRVEDLAFSPRDGALAVAREVTVETLETTESRHQIELWDVRRRTITNAFAGQAPICYSADGRLFACQGLVDGTIQFRDAETDRTWSSEGGFEVSPDRNEFAFSPDGKTLASGSGIGELKLWRLEPPERRFGARWEVRELLTLASDHPQGIKELRFVRAAGDDILASSDAAGGVRLWRANAAPASGQTRRPTPPRQASP